MIRRRILDRTTGLLPYCVLFPLRAAWWLHTIGCALLGVWHVSQTVLRTAIVADLLAHHTIPVRQGDAT